MPGAATIVTPGGNCFEKYYDVSHIEKRDISNSRVERPVSIYAYVLRTVGCLVLRKEVS